MPGPDNADFRAGCCHTVAVLKDMNASGGTVSRHGGYAPDMEPVAGQTAVVCRVTEKPGRTLLQGGKDGEKAFFVVQFPDAPSGLDRTTRLLWVDDGGESRTVILEAKPQAKWTGSAVHHWRATGYEIRV